MWKWITLGILLTATTGLAQDETELELPDSSSAKPLGDDANRIVIEITAPVPSKRELEDPKIAQRWPDSRRERANKVFVDGEAMDFVKLQSYLEKQGRMNPKYRDPMNPLLSSRKLLIRCEVNQAFDYVKAILQICAHPEIAIYRVEIATRGEKAVPSWLPTDMGTLEQPGVIHERVVKIKLKQPTSDEDPRPIRKRTTQYYLGKSRIEGEEAVILRRIEEHLVAARQQDAHAAVRIEAGIGVPHGCVVGVMDLAHVAGIKKVVFTGLAVKDGLGKNRLWWNKLRQKLDAKKEQGQRSRNSPRVVDDALAWLAKQQQSDGRWSDETSPGLDSECTGLALLAFLGAGETHKVGRYRNNVRLGLKWLRRLEVDGNGWLGGDDLQARPKNHLVANLALVEAYALTRSPLFKASAQRSLERVWSSAEPYADITAFFLSRPEPDVAFWLMMLAQSAKSSGLAVPANAVQRIVTWLEPRAPKDKTGTMQATLAIGRRLTQPKSTMDIQAARPAATLAHQHVGTVAAYRTGGKAWLDWSRQLNGRLTPTEAGQHAGSFSTDPTTPTIGRLRTTAIMTLCAEVYFRYGRVIGVRQ